MAGHVEGQIAPHHAGALQPYVAFLICHAGSHSSVLKGLAFPSSLPMSRHRALTFCRFISTPRQGRYCWLLFEIRHQAVVGLVELFYSLFKLLSRLVDVYSQSGKEIEVSVGLVEVFFQAGAGSP